MSLPISRRAYAEMYGPTTGDRVRLGDTDLLIEVEKDYCQYGEECKFGGGKVLRDGMGQAAGISQGLVRLAVGLDHIEDIKADLLRGLKKFT